jgi:hypothetical protein
MQHVKNSGILMFQMIWKVLSATGYLPEMLVMFYYYVKTGNNIMQHIKILEF